jgi:hypothetical protein
VLNTYNSIVESYQAYPLIVPRVMMYSPTDRDWTHANPASLQALKIGVCDKISFVGLQTRQFCHHTLGTYLSVSE